MVTGIMAQFLERFPDASPPVVMQSIKDNAYYNALLYPSVNTVSAFAQVCCGSGRCLADVLACMRSHCSCQRKAACRSTFGDSSTLQLRFSGSPAAVGGRPYKRPRGCFSNIYSL